MKKIILKSVILLWAAVAACSCDNLLEEKAYDFVSPEQLGDSESAASQLVTGAYNTIITNFIAPGSYLYLTNVTMLLVLHGHLVMWELVIRRDFGE